MFINLCYFRKPPNKNFFSTYATKVISKEFLEEVKIQKKLLIVSFITARQLMDTFFNKLSMTFSG